jgi:hypothetical protein
VGTVKVETESDEEVDFAISHGTEPVLALKIKERWQHCQNAWKQQVSCRRCELSDFWRKFHTHFIMNNEFVEALGNGNNYGKKSCEIH